MQWSSVDFPEPDGPMIPIKRPDGMSSVTSSSARTAASSAPYSFVARSARAATAVVIAVAGVGVVVVI